MSTGLRDRSLPDPAAEPTITIPRAGRILGMSRNAAYAAARDGRFPVIAISPNRSVVLTGEFLERYRLRRVA
jgi:predicted DNA-binding transcriptional regulator AlpA